MKIGTIKVNYLAKVCQLIVTSSKITEPLKISKRITKNTAKRAPKTPIKTVVPHPGATLPYSEFNGRNKVPSAILKKNFFNDFSGFTVHEIFTSYGDLI